VNAFNRVIMVLLLCALLLAAVALAVFPEALLRWIATSAEAWSDLLGQFASGSSYLYIGLRVVLILVAAIAIGALLFLELRRRRVSAVRIVTSEGNRATVVTDAVSQRLVYHIDRLADVIQVSPEVAGRGGTVDVRLDLETGPEIDVPTKTNEVVAVARAVVEEQMGLRLGRINVQIRHAPYPHAPRTQDASGNVTGGSYLT
jgi:membrane protein implicated in regulation of membrane protease activity